MRKSGVLMHITSLPGNYGIGSMGKNAYAFVDFLKAAGQSLWQILPLSPTGFGDSPYQSCSSYAGNPYLIDLDTLVQEGFLLPGEPEEITWSYNGRVDYGIQYNCRTPLLRKAYARFRGGEEFEAFRSANSAWLSDFCLFLALKSKTGGKPWYEWEDALKYRQADAIWNARQELQDEIRFYAFVQFLFFPSGMLCTSMPTTTASPSSAMCLSMFLWTAWMCGLTPSCSSWMRPWHLPLWPDAPRITSPRMASSGVTLCTATM